MKKLFVLLFVASLVWTIGFIIAFVLADYEYKKTIQSYWELGVKTSTLAAKAEQVDKYVQALENAGLPDSAALWLKTPDNSVEQNMEMLRSLQRRMHDIRQMDVGSFQYQQAMAQITQQEQNEAFNMLAVFRSAWFLRYHFFMWNWMGLVSCVVLGVPVLVFGSLALEDYL